MLRCLLISMTCITLASATASSDEDQIRLLFRRALTGDKAAVEPCIAKLEATVKADPSNQLAHATLGSAITLRSRDMGWGPAKLRTLNEGIAVMNSAVAASPDDAHVRLIRAFSLGALPAFLGRKAEARRDFAWLQNVMTQHPERLTPDEQRSLREHLAKVAH